MSNIVVECLKNSKTLSAKQIKKSICDENLKKLIPKRCKICGSKYLYYDSMAGPIVGGIGTCRHLPNAHPTGAWICLDCQENRNDKR